MLWVDRTCLTKQWQAKGSGWTLVAKKLLSIFFIMNMFSVVFLFYCNGLNNRLKESMWKSWSLLSSEENNLSSVILLWFLTNFCLYLRPKKLTLKGYKQYWCTFKDITISCYKSREEAHGTPAHQMNLRGERSLQTHDALVESVFTRGVSLLVPHDLKSFLEVVIWLKKSILQFESNFDLMYA